MSGFNISKEQETQTLDNERVWVHIRSPKGHLLFVGGESDDTGKVPDEDNPGEALPARVQVMSVEAIEYMERLLQLSRAAQDAEPDNSAAGLRKAAWDRLGELITGFENFADADGRPLDAGRAEDRVAFVSANPSWSKQVDIASKDVSGFLGYGSDSFAPSEQDSDG